MSPIDRDCRTAIIPPVQIDLLRRNPREHASWISSVVAPPEFHLIQIRRRMVRSSTDPQSERASHSGCQMQEAMRDSQRLIGPKFADTIERLFQTH